MNPTLLTTAFDGDISADAIAAWLEQFDPEDRDLITKLLLHFLYYSPRRLTSRLRDLHRIILELLGTTTEHLWFTPVGYVAKSGAAIAYFYRKANNVPLDRFVSASDLPRLTLTSHEAIVVLDDYIGSGHQASEVWKQVVARTLSRAQDSKAVFAAVVAQERGTEYLREHSGFSVVAADILSDAVRPLSSASRIFRTDDERANARRVLEKYASRLGVKYPLGYAQTEGLVSFFYSTPNNTLPIFWATTGTWKPLLPHGDSFRDPNALVGPRFSDAPGIAAIESRRPLIETAELDGYDIPTEVVISLLVEFRTLPIVLLLTPIIKTLKISDSALTSILKLVAELKYFEHEREPVRASFVVIPEDIQIDPVSLLFESAPGQNASKISELLTLVQTIDGFDGATVIRANGTVVGNVMFPESDERVDRYIPKRYSAPAAASIRFNGPVFTFAGNGRASIFHRGKRVMVHRGASWHYQPSDLDRGLSALAAMNQVEADVLKEVLIVAYELSDAGRGGFITIGDADAVLQWGGPLKSSGLNWTPQPIGSIGREALLGLISRDGTTVLTSDGLVLQGMTDLRPPLGGGETEEGKGIRHATSADVSAATRAVCVTVSVTGQISVYANGAVVLKMMG